MEPPPELLGPQPAGDSVHLEAHVSGKSRVNQAGRDLHLHYQDGVRGARRVKPGAQAVECPYPGLASFGREQAQWFFGRDELTSDLITRLDARLSTGGVQVVVAPSGAGKSSLLHAGLLPQLDSDALPGSSRWPTMVLTPTARPLAALATQVAGLTGADPATLAQELVVNSTRTGAVLREALCGCLGGDDPKARVVVVVDQFEELFTLCTDDQHRRTFIELLSQLASPQSDSNADTQPVGLVVVGIRADFYTACVNYPYLRTALQDNPLVVGPMSDTELRAAILYPAHDVGLDVEPGLLELLLRDLGHTATTASAEGRAGYEAGRLPLLAHALRVTWQQRHGHTLTVEGYQTAGGIHRAVATTAEAVFTGVDHTGQHAARTLFLRLIKIGDGTKDTRRRLARTDLLLGLNPDTVVPVLDTFTQARLLTQDQDTVEITHEALLHAWPRLRQWIDTDRAGNLIRQQLDEAATVWDRDGRDTAGLYRGNRLEAARTWATSRPRESDLSPAASAFLAASTHQERRAVRLRRTMLVVLAVLALLASGAAVVAFHQQRIAFHQQQIATVRQLITQADAVRETDPRTALLLGIAAERLGPGGEAQASLVNTLTTTRYAGTLLDRTSPVSSVAFSPDGRTVAAGDSTGTVIVWNLADPARPRHALAAHTGSVSSVAFSPDGRTLATGSFDGRVIVWDLADLTRPRQFLAAGAGSVFSVAFSPDGRTVAAGDSDGTVIVWDLADPARPRQLGSPHTGRAASVFSVAFSPDGHTLATANDDGTALLWDLADSTRPQRSLAGHSSSVNSVAFAPDGRTLATASDDGTALMWDLTDLTRPQRLRPTPSARTSKVTAVAFAPNGRILATASDDGTALLWDLTDLTRPQPLRPALTSHTGRVTAVAFAPDGRTLAIAGSDATVVLWDLTARSQPQRLGQPLTGQPSSVDSVRFAPDGRTLTTTSSDGTVIVRDLTNTDRPRLTQSHTRTSHVVDSLAVAPDGRTLVTAGANGSVILWDLTDRTQPRPLGQPLSGHRSLVTAAAFSADGRTLVTAGDEGSVILWDLTDRTQPRPLGQPLTGHAGSATAVALTPDGNTLAAGGSDATVILWNLTKLNQLRDHATQRACTITGDGLNRAEWVRYIPGLPYQDTCPVTARER
jgi:WD40 repeat protein